jgi:hypothetical protein
MVEHEHHTQKCIRCGRAYCPTCDYPSGTAEVGNAEPYICGVCLEVHTPWFEAWRRVGVQ